MTTPAPLTHRATCDCGWTSNPCRSNAQAAYALRLHSCDTHRRRLEAAARNQARLDRLAAIDRTPKPCTCKRAHHEHGTYAAYVSDGCRCRPCADACAAYERARVRRNAYGRSNLTDAEPVREHVHALMAAGIGLKSITRHTGINGGALSKLVYGIPGQRPPSRRVTKTTAAKILALGPDDPTLLADGARIDPTGTRRRLQALATLGWSVGALADHAGIDRQRLDGAMHGRDVLAATARAVTTTYERLWDTPAPTATKGEKVAATRTKKRAAEHGWVPPLAWDEHAIDDPIATPWVDEVTTARAASHGAGRVNADSIHDCAHEWGLTREQAADRLTVTRGAIDAWLARYDEECALRSAFHRNAIAQGLDHPTRDGLGLRRTA